MGRGILRGAGWDENLKFNFIWPNEDKTMVYILIIISKTKHRLGGRISQE